jgi:hypothetical protein
MKATSEAALGRARMTLTALFRSFAHANDNETQARVCVLAQVLARVLAQVPLKHRQAMAKKKPVPKIAATVAIENVQSDDEPQAVV